MMKKPTSPESPDPGPSPTLPESVASRDPSAYAELDYLLDHLDPDDTQELTPEQFEAGLVGEWTFFARCVRNPVFRWKPDPAGNLSPFVWRFYPEGLMWEQSGSGGGQWLPYSVYRARRELLIVRDPRPGKHWREEHYLLALLSRRFLWLYEVPDKDEEDDPQACLIFWKRERQEEREE